MILTHIAYRIQNTYLLLATCKKLTKQYTETIKHKAGFARTSPNSTFFHHQIYGLRTIENIQTQQHISTIYRLLNHSNFQNSSLRIRLQQIQNTAATNISILTEHNYILPKKQADTPLALMLLHLQQLQISFINNNNNWPKPLEQQGTTINTILYLVKKPHQIKFKLNKIGLYFIEQLTNYNNTTLLS